MLTFLTTRDLWYWERYGGMNGGKVGSDGVGDDGGVGKGCAEDSMVKMVVRVLLKWND